MNTIATDNPFSGSLTATLSALAGLLIPASAEFDVPGANDPDVIESIVSAARGHAEQLNEGLSDVENRAQAQFAKPFPQLAHDEAMTIVTAMQQADSQFVRAFVAIAVQCYYRDPRVMTSLGMAPRPPYPEGFELAQGDWSLLDPVRARGKVWRDAN